MLIMKKALKTLALTGGILCAVKGLDNRLEVTHYIMESPKIPKAFNNFRILQISDYHADTVSGVIGEARCQSPDIIVSTGDLVHDKGSYAPGVRLCEQLMKIAPVFAVNGNHDIWRSDYSQFEKELSNVGVRTLHNERVELKIGEDAIGLCGIDDPFSIEGTNLSLKLREFLNEIPPYKGYDILLFHRANLFDTLKDFGFDLILSGHMHGGQFRLPNGKGVVAPKSGWGSSAPMLFPKYVGGHYRYNGTEMLVSRGIGNPMIIPRLFNRPEIVVVTLKHGEEYEQ
jgi:predicted MPP superfamily phosphohydrolase